MKTPRPALIVFACFLLICTSLYAQEEEPKKEREYKPREQKLYIDIPMTIAEIMLINITGNIYWRLWGPDSEAAYFTADSIRRNLNPRVWGMEKGQGGDTFLVNQFFHPYAGGLYLASARSNNINYYWSILSSVFGTISWEALGERDSPALSDSINTALGGIVIGEVLHRLYIELDKGGIGGKIGASFLSPTDRLTAAVRGYGPDKSPSKFYDTALVLGFSWINAKFFDNFIEIASWNTPSAFVGVDLVYGDPYTAHSKTPFDQFDLITSLTISPQPFYNFTFITDGYLASWLIADNDADQASGGITIHFDDYVTDKGFMDMNNGRENLSFNANSLGYSVKWLRQDCNILDKPFVISLKTHLGFTPWAVTDYNGGIDKDDYNLYLFGGNIKLFFELRRKREEGGGIVASNGGGAASRGAKNGQVLALSLCFYDTWNIPNTPGFEVNTLFLNSMLSYSFPLTKKLSIYAADNFMLLYCRLFNNADIEFPDITRWYNSARIGIKISL